MERGRSGSRAREAGLEWCEVGLRGELGVVQGGPASWSLGGGEVKVIPPPDCTHSTFSPRTKPNSRLGETQFRKVVLFTPFPILFNPVSILFNPLAMSIVDPYQSINGHLPFIVDRFQSIVDSFQSKFSPKRVEFALAII